MEAAFGWIGDLFAWVVHFVPRFCIMPYYKRGIRVVHGTKCTFLKNGWYFYWPLVHHVYSCSIAWGPLDVPADLMTTGDDRRVQAGGVVRVRVKDDPESVFKYLLEHDDAENDIVEDAAVALYNAVVSQDYDEIRAARERRVDELTREARASLDAYGVEVRYLRLSTFAETQAVYLGGAGGSYVPEAEEEEDDEE